MDFSDCVIVIVSLSLFKSHHNICCLVYLSALSSHGSPCLDQYRMHRNVLVRATSVANVHCNTEATERHAHLLCCCGLTLRTHNGASLWRQSILNMDPVCWHRRNGAAKSVGHPDAVAALCQEHHKSFCYSPSWERGRDICEQQFFGATQHQGEVNSQSLAHWYQKAMP